MNVSQFIEKVRTMRSFQTAWFRRHQHSDLVKAKQLEDEVDKALAKGIELDEQSEPTATQTSFMYGEKQ